MSTNKPSLKARVEEITPKQAEAFLEQMPMNRPVAQRTVDKYANDMRRGKWRVTGEPIILDENGNLINGQHRMWACIQAGVNFTTLVVYGVDEEAIWSIDQNRSRGVAQVLAMHGLPNANRTTAVARTVDILEYGDSGRSFSVDDIRSIMRRHKGIDWIMSQSNVSSGGVVNTSGPLAAFAIFCERYGEEKAAELWQQFSEGIGLSVGDPLHTIRRHLEGEHGRGSKGSNSAPERAKRVLTALMYVVEGRKMSKSQKGLEGVKHFFPKSKAA